mmetsp:Transcript_59205/g.145329  ORF Transcript_59205/g.145329 Transcript_59205/m.145329 type:complete len:422 (-) Transcript_59205:1140-2405(-)
MGSSELAVHHEQEGVDQRDVVELVKPPRLARVPCSHVHLAKRKPVVSPLLAHLGNPLCRLPVGHTRVREPARGKQVRVLARSDLVIGRVGLNVVIGLLALGRVAPLRELRRGEGQGEVAHGVEHINKGHLPNDGLEEAFPREVHRGTNKQPPSRPALDGDVALRGELLLDEVLGARDEVGEGILLVEHLAIGVVPLVPAVSPPPDVGDGVDEATVDHAEAVCAEGSRHRDPVGAIAVEQERGRPIDRRVLSVHDSHRDLDSVGGRGVDAPAHVVFWGVSRGHLLHLAEHPLPLGNVVVEGRLRGCGGAVADPDVGRVVLIRPPQAKAVCLLVEADYVLAIQRDGVLAHCARRNDEARESGHTLRADEVTIESLNATDQDSLLVRDELTPVGLPRRRDGRRHDLEIESPALIGQDDQILLVV